MGRLKVQSTCSNYPAMREKPPRSNVSSARRIDRLRQVKGELIFEPSDPDRNACWGLSDDSLSGVSTRELLARNKYSRRRAAQRKKWDEHLYQHSSMEEPDDDDKPGYVIENAAFLSRKHNFAVTRIQSNFRGYQVRLMLMEYYLLVAALKIQAAFRGMQARQELYRHRCARKIQSVWRGVAPRDLRKELQQQSALANQAATKIQALWRTIPARYDLLCYRTVRKIQATVRRYQAQSRYSDYLKTVDSATKIQAAWRSFCCQCDYKLFIDDIVKVQSIARTFLARRRCLREQSAVQIQRIVRGCNGRTEYAILQEMFLLECCTIDIQRVFRGHRVRKRVAIHNYIIRSVVAIQSCWRRYDAQQKFWYAIGSAIEIQCLARKAAARDYFLDALNSVLTIQCSVRMWLAQRRYKEVYEQKVQFDASCLVQNAWRTSCALTQLKEHLRARTIQTAWRCYRERFRYLSWMAILEAATRIQKTWRGYLCYSDYAMLQSDVLTIQRVFRGFKGRKRFKKKMKRREKRRALDRFITICVTDIQRMYRGHMTRNVATRIRHENLQTKSATRIQCSWRCYVAREKRFYAVGSAILIQACARGLVCRLAYMDTIGQIIISQSVARRYIARQQFAHMKAVAAVLETGRREQVADDAAVKVLQYFYKTTVRGVIMEAAATKIQGFFRMVKAMVDREIRAADKRRKMRKLLRNRTKQTDDMLLEDAWGSMTIGSFDIPGFARPGAHMVSKERRRTIPRNVNESTSSDDNTDRVRRSRRSPSRDRRSRKEEKDRLDGSRKSSESKMKNSLSMSRKSSKQGAESVQRNQLDASRQSSEQKSLKKRTSSKSKRLSFEPSASPSKATGSEKELASSSKKERQLNPNSSKQVKSRLPRSDVRLDDDKPKEKHGEDMHIGIPQPPGIVRTKGSDASVVSVLTTMSDMASPLQSAGPRSPHKRRKVPTISSVSDAIGSHTRENEAPKMMNNNSGQESTSRRKKTGTARGKSHFKSRSKSRGPPLS